MKNIISIVALAFCFTASFAQETKPIKHDKIELQMPFYEGLSATKQNGKWGFINDKNEIIIPIIYSDVGYFIKGYAPVKINGKISFINKVGIMGEDKFETTGAVWSSFLCKENGVWYDDLMENEMPKKVK